MAFANITDKRREVKNGLVYAELKSFFEKALKVDGFSAVEVQRSPASTTITVWSPNTKDCLNREKEPHLEKNQCRARSYEALLQKRFGAWLGKISLAFDRTNNKGLDANVMCASLIYKLEGGLAVRRACYGILRFIMEAGAHGAEIVVSGKLRGQRAKSMKFVAGKMIHSGDPTNHYIREAIHHFPMKQGVLGVKVKILLKFDPNANTQKGPHMLLPDTIHVEKWMNKPAHESTLKMIKNEQLLAQSAPYQMAPQVS